MSAIQSLIFVKAGELVPYNYNYPHGSNHYQNIHEPESPEHDRLCAWFSNAFNQWKKTNFQDDSNIKLPMEYPITNGRGEPIRYVDFVLILKKIPSFIIEVKPKVSSMGTTVRQMKEYKTRIPGDAPLLLVTFEISAENYEAIRSQDISILLVSKNNDREWNLNGNRIADFDEYHELVSKYQEELEDYESRKNKLERRIAQHEVKLEKMKGDQVRRETIAKKMPQKLSLLKGLNDLVLSGHKMVKVSEFESMQKELESLSPPIKPEIDEVPYYCFFSMLLNVKKLKKYLSEDN